MSILDKLESEINYKYSEKLTKPIIFDGSCIRMDHIWVYAHEWEYKGNILQSISYGSWKIGDNNLLKSWDQELEKDKNFLKNYKNKTLEIKSKIDLDVQKKQKACKEKWTELISKFKDCKEHDYLKFKNVESYNLKIDQNGVLIIPCHDINGLTGVQRIFKNPETNKFEKRFSSGIKMKGSIYALKPFENEKFCYISEGYATSATIQKLYPSIPSICCFNAGNISEAINTIRTANADIKIIIAADNDHATKGNPGLKKANEAVRRFKNCILKYPKFSLSNPSWTDFNDLSEFESSEKAFEQLAFTVDEFASLICLGYNNSSYFYMSSENQQIVTLTAKEHNRSGLRQLFANRSYWLKNYPIESDDDIKVDWERACEELMFKCHQAGIFDPSQVRGIGVWQDGDKYCINDGSQVINANQNSIFHYQKNVKFDYSFRKTNPDNMIQLLSAFQNLEYKNKNDYFYLSAWYIQAQIFSVLPWRFHIWVTGSAGSGKSTILKWLHGLSMNNILTNNTTAAGIRQEIKSNACSIIYDESEATEEKTRQVINLAREMSSNGDFKALRGSVSGNSISHNTQCVMCFGSVQIDLEKQTDRSRMFVIEMATTLDQDPQKFTAINEIFEHFIKNKNEIWTIIYNSIDSIIYNYNFCKSHLKKEYKMESRLADQIGMAMACFWVYFSQEKIEHEQYKKIIEKFGLTKSEYAESNDEKEHESCYDSLMGVILDNYSNTTVAQAIHNLRMATVEEYSFVKMLGVFGLKYIKEEEALFVPSKNIHLKKKMPEYSDITRVLMRDEKNLIKSKDRVRITQIGNVRGIRVKVKL